MDKCCGKDLVWTKISGSWENYAIERSCCPVCKTIRDRKDGIIYTKKEDCFLCGCGTEVLAAQILHPIHDGPFPLSGSGRVRTEMAPFCPKCETKPSSSGKIISR
ncbi:MAG TPA: hypothetical protein P5089_00155 [Candidatus Portnoybacteria bacterium]|nr:hypothetical protein [Candidatus Portnoybacteria bacterium]